MIERTFAWAERGLIPDPLVRFGIRRMLVERLRDQDRGDAASQRAAEAALIEQLDRSPIAESTDDANQQHYEVPARLFQLMLGPRLKYSCCLWPKSRTTLAEAEEAMLELTCERAALGDAQRILELGCGWGSLTLWMAERYPDAAITAVSNSHSQRRFIEAQCRDRGLRNVTIVTADMNEFEADEPYDRVVSVEMFEHMRNYRELLRRIAGWLSADGKLFVHLFCHRRFAYLYEPSGPTDWMAREFFTGGTMPSAGLLAQFCDDLRIEQEWIVDGGHYQRTLESWLRNLDRHRSAALEVLADGGLPPERWLQRWRLFLLACSELFGYRSGSEWAVAHYRFSRADAGRLASQDSTEPALRTEEPG